MHAYRPSFQPKSSDAYRLSFDRKSRKYVFPLRNNQDLEAFIDEVSAVYDKTKTLLDVYRVCTSKPHHFLYVNLMAKDKDNMFYDSLINKIKIN